MSLCCRNCGETTRRSLRGALVHVRQQSVFCGDRSALPLPEPTTTAQLEQPVEEAITTYRPQRHRVVKRAA